MSTIRPLEADLAPFSATPSQVLTTALFQHHMTAMKMHYQSADEQGNGPSHTYVLPSHVLSSALMVRRQQAKAEVNRRIDEQYDQLARIGAERVVVHAISGFEAQRRRRAESATAKVHAVIKKGQTDLTAFVNQQRDFCTTQMNKLQSTHNTAAFASAMEARKQQAKAEANRRIDEQYDQLIKIGTEHSELQPTILTASQGIGAYVTVLIAKLGAFLSDIYHKIVGWIGTVEEWVRRAGDAIKNGANKILDELGDAVDSVLDSISFW